MANGMEDLREKNKGRETVRGEKRYPEWNRSLGREDSEMLMEKAHNWSVKRKNRDYDD